VAEDGKKEAKVKMKLKMLQLLFCGRIMNC